MTKTQSQINFIKQVCGGDSLSHILSGLKRAATTNDPEIVFGMDNLLNYCQEMPERDINKPWFEEFDWILSTKRKERNLSNQTNHTIKTISRLLGFKEEVEHDK